MKPQPVPVNVICSLCDQPWDAHGDKPSQDDCIRLLKAALSSKPAPVVVYRDRYPYAGPYWYQGPTVYGTGTFQVSSGLHATTTNAVTFGYHTPPPRGDDGPTPVAA